MSPFFMVACVAVEQAGLFYQILWLLVSIGPVDISFYNISSLIGVSDIAKPTLAWGAPFLVIKPLATIITMGIKVLNQ